MIESVQIQNIELLDESETYDIWVYEPDAELDDSHPGGNYIANSVIVHNSIPEIMARRDDQTEAWKKDIHPGIYEILKDTYGGLVYQEQLTALWQKFAGFTSPECQEARKAVAKKWADKLKPVEKKWIEGATKTLGEEEAKRMWGTMVSFGRYAFNACLHEDTLLKDHNTGIIKTIKEWYNGFKPFIMPSYLNGEIIHDKCVAIHNNGPKDVYEIEFSSGKKERVTLEHQFLCSDNKYHTVAEIIDYDLDVIET